MRVLVVTGEASGDAHAAKVVRALQARGATVTAVGGPAIAATGARILERIENLSVVGFVEVAARLPRLWSLGRRLQDALRRHEYDLFIPVDFAGFNLRVAAAAATARVPVLYYIGPQVWAWRAHRLATMRRVATHVALILPFEKPLYDRAGIPATFVGHPLLDDVARPEAPPDTDLGLFPGSRAQEISRHLPLLLQVARRLRSVHPDLRVLVSRAPTVDARAMAATLRAHGFDPATTLADEPARGSMQRCRALLVASGTATLEAALSERPFAVLYRTNPINYAIVRRLVRVQYAALANLVAGESVVREYLQRDATAGALAGEATRLLEDETERQRQILALRRTRARLGEPGGSERVAELAVATARMPVGAT